MEYPSDEVPVEATDAVSFSDESDDVALALVESSLEMDLFSAVFRDFFGFLESRVFSTGR